MADVVYRVVETRTRTIDIAVPEEIVNKGFDAAKKHATETAIIFHLAPETDDVKEETELKAFIRLDGLG